MPEKIIPKNEAAIKSLKWTKDQRIALGDNLYLNLRRSSKTYIVRKSVNGKQQVITLGKHPALSLREARLQAMQLKRKADVSTVTVGELINQFWRDVAEPASKVPNQVRGYLNHIDAEFDRLKLIDITRAQLVRFIQKYSKERGARSADRLRSYLKQVFAYAVELGYLDTSPMEGVTKRVTGYRPIERSRTLSEDEIRMVFGWDHDNAKVIRFLLLTGLRISEAMTGYVDGDRFRVDDTKGKHGKHETKPHWVYLTGLAKEQLPLPRMTATNVQAWLRRRLDNEGIEERFTPHDCRRTFATLGSDNKVMPHIIEKCLNHKMEGMLAVYNHAEYADERIDAAKQIESLILGVINDR